MRTPVSVVLVCTCSYMSLKPGDTACLHALRNPEMKIEKANLFLGLSPVCQNWKCGKIEID